MNSKLTRFCPILFLVLVGVAELGLSKPLGQVTFDENYDLFYQEPFHRLMPRIKAAVPNAYEHIITLWGLQNVGGLRHPLTVQIKEIPSKSLGRWESAHVEAWGSGKNLKQILVVDIKTYMQHPDEDLEQVIAHEMSHVILMDVISESGAASIPPWFNEGLAQSSTYEGHKRVRNDIRALAYSGLEPVLCNLDGPVDEFAHGPFNGGCYPEFYLAVQRLKQKGGPESISKIIKGLRQGTPFRDLIQSLTGMDWPAFKQDAERYTAEVLGGVKAVP